MIKAVTLLLSATLLASGCIREQRFPIRYEEGIWTVNIKQIPDCAHDVQNRLLEVRQFANLSFSIQRNETCVAVGAGRTQVEPFPASYRLHLLVEPGLVHLKLDEQQPFPLSTGTVVQLGSGPNKLLLDYHQMDHRREDRTTPFRLNITWERIAASE